MRETEAERLDRLGSTTYVTARVDIADNPVARVDSSATAGEVGVVCDESDGLLWVDFGRGAIACLPREVE